MVEAMSRHHISAIEIAGIVSGTMSFTRGVADMPEYVITEDGTETLATWRNDKPHVLIFDRKDGRPCHAE